MTDFCWSFGQPEFSIEYDSEFVLKTDVDSVLDFLKQQVAKGTRYNPGQTIQIGWMVDRIEKKGECITLYEPDFEEFPIRFVRGSTRTFHHLRQQKSVAESVGLENNLDFPSILQSGLSCSLHEDSVGFVMHRAEPENNDSGWFIGCPDPKHDHNNPANLKRVSLFELALAKPDIIPFICLPEDSFVRHDTGKVEINFKGNRLSFKRGSFLEKLRPFP